ncbi:MAG: nuclear transport factor 2 family protein [bacterium]|nr:nuclear transport factor 2 family protein [bacterium]MCP5071141.1 nuclear transport factor 2 family protein [bacterium]
MSVTDELAIRNLVARYADAVTRDDGDCWTATWTENGSWHILGQMAQGRSELNTLRRNMMSGFESVVQLPSTGQVSVEAETGHGRWTITEHARLAGGGALSTLGIYDDRYLCEGGVWYFAERRFHALYIGPADLSGSFQPYPK